MPSQKNIQSVEILTEKFKSASAIYLTKYTGINVVQITELRKEFSKNSVDFYVSKNTLSKIAARNAGFDGKLDDFLMGQVAIAYASDDPTLPAKIIKEFKKTNENLEVLGLVFDGEVFEADKYKEISDMPTRDILISKFVSMLNQPMVGLASTLNGAMSGVLNVLGNLKDKKD